MSEKNRQENKETSSNFVPLSSKGWPKWAVYILSLLGMVYLLNPGAGILELLPDNLPIVGNLDEGAATLAIWYGILEIKKARKKDF
jgi:hypothetical protein